MKEMKWLERELSLICCLHLAVLTLCLSLSFALLFPGEHIEICLLWAFGAVLPVQLIHWICLRVAKLPVRYLLCAVVTLAAVLIPNDGYRRMYYGICCAPILIAGLWLPRPKSRIVMTMPRIYHPGLSALVYLISRAVNAPLLPGFAVAFTAFLILNYCFYRNQEQVLQTLLYAGETEITPHQILAVNRRVALTFVLLGVLILATVPWLLTRERTPSIQPNLTFEQAGEEPTEESEVQVSLETVLEPQETEPVRQPFDVDAVTVLIVGFVVTLIVVVVAAIVSILRSISGSNGKHQLPDREWAIERLEHTVRIPKKKDEEPLTGYEKKLRRRYEKLIRSRTPKNTSLMAMTPTELETAAGMDGPAARIVHDLYSRTRYSQEPATRDSYAAFKEAVQQLPDADRSKTADV